jgi:hypothetical protein
LAESVKDAICDVIYGIATVQPNRAIKKCRIRKLRIEYYLNEFAVILVLPRSCGTCDRVEYCTDDFIMQITEKISQRNARFTL